MSKPIGAADCIQKIFVLTSTSQEIKSELNYLLVIILTLTNKQHVYQWVRLDPPLHCSI